MVVSVNAVSETNISSSVNVATTSPPTDPMSGAIAFANITIEDSEEIKARPIRSASNQNKNNAGAIALPIALICALALI